MGQRLDLHNRLLEIAPHVYFQAPPNTQMQYPCLLYARDASSVDHADNGLYRFAKRYMVTVIDHDPDSTLPDQVEELPLCAFVRFYTADELNHWVFDLYF
jgi:hypothetical protein